VIIENFFSNELISAAIKRYSNDYFLIELLKLRHWHFLFGPQFVSASKEQLYQVMEKLIDSDEQLEQPTNNTGFGYN
jgi:hypothetical protein